MRPCSTWSSAIFLVAGALSAFAQDLPAKPTFTDELVRQTIDLALRNISRGICGASPCSPATNDELADPPVTIADGRRAMEAAADSAAAKWCAITNSDRLFLGYIGYVRLGLKYDDRKTSLLSIVHGVTTAQVLRALTARGACPAELRQRLESLAAQTVNRRP